MTIGQLIDELAKYPSHLEVQVLLSHYIKVGNAMRMELAECDALPLDTVKFEGNHVLLVSV